MSDYLNQTEEQQFEEAKNWFKQNGTPILVAITLALASWAGWNFWQSHQQESALKTSATYQQVMESYLQNPEKNQPLVERFIADNKGSSYAVFAQLELAKQQVEKGKFTEAKNALEQALSQTSDVALLNVIRFRLAAVDYQLGNFDSALFFLSQLQDKSWDSRKQILSGDILIAKGDIEAAKSAYQQAKENASEQEKGWIELRLNNL